ncbi:MAG: hypothetical protein KAT68_05440 [Bacteroidales bacterium]|nr:hypothetical protein [Bacteroidales bacterium]
MIKTLNFFNKFKHIHTVLFLLIAIIAYWQIAFLQNSLQWDALDVVLPWRYFASDCLQNGYLPLWNPHQQLGYPIHADLQYPFWYSEVLILGSTIGYNNYTLHFLYIFYIFLAGYGMYRLTLFFRTDKKVAFVTGISYMLSGFFVAHTQSFTLIIGATWIPYILLYYLKISVKKKYIDVLILSFFMFLMISGGYQAFTIILNYFLLIIFLYFIIISLKKRDYKNILILIKLNTVLYVIIILLSSVLFVILYQLTPYLDRMSGMPLENALFFPLTPKSLISLLIPFGVVKDMEIFNTAISMRNIYMGMFMLIFFIYALFKRKSGIEIVLLLLGLFSLLASLGSYLPIREFLYHYVPFMDTFRFPSIFRLFTIITFLVIAGIHLPEFINKIKKDKKIVFYIGIGFILILLTLIIYSLFHISFQDFTFFQIHKDWHELFKNSSIFENIFIHSLIQLILLSVFLIILMKKNVKHSIIKILTVFIIIEMIISVQLNVYYTGVSNVSPREIKDNLSKLPKGFPVPANTKIINNSDQSLSFFPLWRNTNIFHKSISYDSFSSFVLKSYNYFFDSIPHLKNATLNNPLLFLSDKIFSINKLPKELDPNKDNKNIYVNDSIYNKYINIHFNHIKGDTVFITDFSPDQIVAKTKCANTQIITLLQNNYPGWQVFIDNKLVTHFTSNYLFISSIIPAGEHIIKFVYSNKPFIIGFSVSYIVFGIIILLIIIYYIRKDFAGRKYFILIPILILAFILYSIKLNISRKTERVKEYDKIIEQTLDWDKKIGQAQITQIFNIDNPFYIKNYFDSINKKVDFKQFRFKNNQDLTDLINIVDKSTSPYFLYVWSNMNNPLEVNEIIRMMFSRIIEHKYFNNSSITLYKRDNTFKRSSLLSSINDFEKNYQNWSGNIDNCDTIVSYSGKRSLKLDSVSIYSPSFSIKYDEITNADNCIVNIITKAYLKEGAKLSLVLQIDRKGKLLKWYSAPVHEFITHYNEWGTAIFTQQITYDLLPDDILKIYIWNNGKKDVYIDDLSVEFYEID